MSIAQARAADPIVADAPSRGLLVLGMHRSGTSAVSRMLQLAGADIGRDVTGASRGNDDGHWEDAFALAVHERLLAAFDARWDTPFPRPEGWISSDVAQQALCDVERYLAVTRAPYRCWSVKDPRMCLFGKIWERAAEQTGLPLAALVVVRHPWEVAASLRMRDGISQETALLLWLEHMLEAISLAEQMPSRLITYHVLLDDWRGCADRIGSILPGALDFASAAALIDRHLDAGKRHHHAAGHGARLPRDLATVWDALQGMGADGNIAPGTAMALRATLSGSLDLLAGHLRAERASRRQDPAESAAAATDSANNHRQQAQTRALEQQVEALQAECSRADLRRSAAEARAVQAQVQAAESSHRHLLESQRAEAAEARARDEAGRAAAEMQRAAETAVRAEALAARAEAAWPIIEDARSSMRTAEQQREVALQELAQAAHRAADAEKRRAQVQGELADVLRSRSWRITRPLRVLMRVVRGEWRLLAASRLARRGGGEPQRPKAPRG